MGFRCDQYTLNQRLQAERHERLVAEENLQRELTHTRDTLQVLDKSHLRHLDGSCQDLRACVVLQVLCDRLTEADSREMVLQMKNRLQTVEENMENVLAAAEVLGAAHQVAHVTDLRQETSRHRLHIQTS